LWTHLQKRCILGWRSPSVGERIKDIAARLTGFGAQAKETIMSTKTARKGTKTRKTRKSQTTELVAGPPVGVVEPAPDRREALRWEHGLSFYTPGIHSFSDPSKTMVGRILEGYWCMAADVLREGYVLGILNVDIGDACDVVSALTLQTGCRLRAEMDPDENAVYVKVA
jgi:hypothetical protein